jgi:hypothetical protein
MKHVVEYRNCGPSPECTKLIHLEPKSSVAILLDAERHLLSNIEQI